DALDTRQGARVVRSRFVFGQVGLVSASQNVGGLAATSKPKVRRWKRKCRLTRMSPGSSWQWRAAWRTIVRVAGRVDGGVIAVDAIRYAAAHVGAIPCVDDLVVVCASSPVRLHATAAFGDSVDDLSEAIAERCWR